MLNCKSAHSIFYQEKMCSEMVFQAYLGQFDGVVAIVLNTMFDGVVAMVT